MISWVSSENRGRMHVLIECRVSTYRHMYTSYTQKEGIDKKKRQYAPLMFESHAFNEAQLKMGIYCEEFLAVYYGFELRKCLSPHLGLLKEGYCGH